LPSSPPAAPSTKSTTAQASKPASKKKDKKPRGKGDDADKNAKRLKNAQGKKAHNFIILIFAELTHRAEEPTHRAEDSARFYYSNNTLRPSSPSDP